MTRTQAFAVFVSAELLRSFVARSETKPVWLISEDPISAQTAVYV